MKRGRNPKATPTDYSQTRGRDSVYKKELFEKLGRFIFAALQNPKLRKRFELDFITSDLDLPEEFFRHLRSTEPTTQSSPQPKKIIQPIAKHIGFRKSEKIKDTYEELYNNALIGYTFENFSAHCCGGEWNRKIPWLRGINLLTYTFCQMMDKEIFAYYDNPFKIIAEHFCDADWNDFTPDQLRKNHSKKINKLAKKQMVDSIISRILKKGDGK